MALNPVVFAPLLILLLIGAVVGLAVVSDLWDTFLTRHARRIFGRTVKPSAERQRRLRAAFINETYRGYAAKTYLFTGLAGITGAILAGYALGVVLLSLDFILSQLQGLPRTITGTLGIPPTAPEISLTITLLLLLGAGFIGGIGAAGFTYLGRWDLPRSRADVRARSIEEGLPRMLAFMYALSRGGVAVPDILRTFSENKEIYGANAEEIQIAVREMDLFGRDMVSAIRNMTERTPSEEFKTFGENLSSILQSGQQLSRFLKNEYERYQDEARERQQEILERLATVAEAYVTMLVAAVLFLITILLVFGLTTTDTLIFIQLIGYLFVPLANTGFIVYLGQKMQQLGISTRNTTSVLDRLDTGSPEKPRPPQEARADGGSTGARAGGLSQIRTFDRLRSVRRVLSSPLQTVLWHPTRILFVTVPIALVYIGLRAPAAFETSVVNLRVLDDMLIQATLFVLATFAVVRLWYTRRVRTIEAATPEFLERLASLNEAGMTIGESLERLRGSDVGVLSKEVERISADVTFGSNTRDALIRFGRRVRTKSITRVVALLTNAMRASGSLGPVLRIASTQARADDRLRRQRRQQMLTYLVVIYISFVVFLVIIVAVQEVLVPSLPSQVPTPDTSRLGVNVDQFARFGSVDKAAYTLAFFHTAIIHAVFTGFVGGMLGEGTLRDGAKHAALLLGIAYVAFILLSSPVASVTMVQPAGGDGAVTIDSASLSNGGFVVIHDGDQRTAIVGATEYLQPGTHGDITVQLEGTLSSGQDVTAVVYQDTNGDRILQLEGADADTPYKAAGNAEFVASEISVS
jgi:flagellar protein FlaJ